MRVNEREIVRIGIIKLRRDERGVEGLCKRVCKGTAPHNHTYPQTSPNTPHFAQQFAQLVLNLHLCATQCANKMEIILLLLHKYAIVCTKYCTKCST
jgi:hypothetical protein